jgi:hypothetical protein
MLEEKFWRIAGRNILIYKHAQEIISAFAKENIPAMALKGLVLADSIYPHLGMRMMADLDFLIRKEGIDSACIILENLGYTLKRGNPYHLYTKNDSIDICVDLRTEIPYLGNQNVVWDSAIDIEINSIKVKTLSTEESLIFFCYHLIVGHASLDNKWLEDIHRFIVYYKEKVGWKSLVEKIKHYKLENPCYWAFLKTKERFSTPIPEYLFRDIRPKSSLRSWVFRLVFQNERRVPFADYLVGAFSFSFPRLLSYAFPRLKVLELRYNARAPLVYFFYLFRPFMLVINAARGVIAAVFRTGNLP